MGFVFKLDSAGEGDLFEDADERVDGDPGDYSAGNTAQIERDGADCKLLAEGVEVGTYGSLAIAEGTVAEVTAMADGCGSIEIYSKYIKLPFRV